MSEAPTAVCGRRWLLWCAGAAALVLLTVLCLGRAYPFLPPALTLHLELPVGIADRREPLIAMGKHGQGDFLEIRYLDEKTAVIAYDSWNVGGPKSEPIPYEPGSRHTLHVELPALSGIRPAMRKETRPMRVTYDGREILNAHVRFYARTPAQVFFGVNPIGGDTGSTVFRGKIFGVDGRDLRGGPSAWFPGPQRLVFWLKGRAWEALLVVAASVLLAFLARQLARWCHAHLFSALPARTFVGHPRAPHRWFAGTALVCAVGFATLVTNGTFRFRFEESFGTFYDHQAASFLQGRLDVPEPALSGEAFVVDGKVYGYFGITPALLRVPFAVAGFAFGQLSRGFMLAYYLAALLAAYLILCHATRALAGPEAWPSRWAVVVFLGCAGLGSPFVFLGSRAYLYHEAILCGAAFALWSGYFSLRYLAAPERRWWVGALVCGVFAVHARPPAGLFALALLGCVAVAHGHAGWRARTGWSGPLTVGALAALGFLSFNGMSYLKFGTFDGSPLRYSVQYTAERRAKFEDRNFHFSNLRHNLDTYLFRPDFHLGPRFPYFYIGGEIRRYPEARIDLEEPALAFPYSMPGLFALATFGGAWALTWAPKIRRPILVLMAGVMPMALALFTAIVTSHRYTGDFCAFFIATGAWGLAVLDAEARGWRRAFLAIASVLTALSIYVTLATALHFQGAVAWGVPAAAQQNYQQLRDRVDAWVKSLAGR